MNGIICPHCDKVTSSIVWRGGTFYNCCKRSFDEPVPEPENNSFESELTTAASDTANAPAEKGVES